jgi:[acyl-carrier-protein] S-malonyltransferase
MKGYIFPGQGSQFAGMCHDLFLKYDQVKPLFNKAEEILGFDISKIMFEGTKEDLTQTKVTQPAIFIHSMAILKVLKDSFKPNLVAGHSLGEFSALVAANYNCPGQVVISGEINAVKAACEKLSEAGARRALILPVGGAFHSELMSDARNELTKAINDTSFSSPICPIYQNVNGLPEISVDNIKNNLISQLTSPVKWTQSVNKMIEDGCMNFIEIGPGNVLQGLVKKINRDSDVSYPEL